MKCGNSAVGKVGKFPTTWLIPIVVTVVKLTTVWGNSPVGRQDTFARIRFEYQTPELQIFLIGIFTLFSLSRFLAAKFQILRFSVKHL